MPCQAAKYGFSIFWVVVIACLKGYFLQVEIARHCLVHNLTTIQALNTLPGPKVRNTSWLVLLFVACSLFSSINSSGILAATAGLFTSVLPLAENESARADTRPSLLQFKFYPHGSFASRGE